jgi:hypothetical protein
VRCPSGVARQVLISIREDWLPALDAFKSQISGLFENYLRLKPLREFRSFEQDKGTIVNRRAGFRPPRFRRQ